MPTEHSLLLLGQLGHHTEEITCLSVSKATGRIFATASNDVINVWVYGKDLPIIQFANTNEIVAMTFDATEQLLATLDREGSLRLWDLHQECEVRRFEVPRSSKALTVANIAFHPFGLVLATQWGSEIAIWDFEQQGILNTVVVPEHSFDGKIPETQIYFSPDGMWLCGANGNHVWLYNIESGRIDNELNCLDSVSTLAFDPVNFLLVAGLQSGAVEAWTIPASPADAFDRVATYIPTSQISSVSSVTISNTDNGWTVATYSDCIKLFSLSATSGLQLRWEVPSVLVSYWKSLCDVQLVESVLMGCSVEGSTVYTWMYNLQETEVQAEDAPSPYESLAIADSILQSSNTEIRRLTSQLTHLKSLKALGASKGLPGMLSALAALNDRVQLLVDLISAGVIEASSVRTVEEATLLLDLLSQVLASACDSHVYTAIDMIRFLLRQYSTACADSFTVIRRQLHGLSTRQSGVGTAARELFKQIPSAH